MNTKATAASKTTSPTCTCGCGEQIGPKATYRPGHDARHAGAVARAIAADPKQEKTLPLALPSPALRAKAQRAAARALAPKPEPTADVTTDTEEQAA